MNWFQKWLTCLPVFFPFYLVRLEVFGVPTTLLEVVMLVTALWWLVKGVREGFLREFAGRVAQQGRRSPLWPLVLFAIAATISVFIVPDTVMDITGETLHTSRMAQGIWKGWIAVPLLYFFMVWSTPKSPLFWRSTLGFLTLSGAGLSVFALQQMLSGDYVTLDGRASGPFESANYLALYLGPVLLGTILSAVEQWQPSYFLRRMFWICSTLVMAVAFWGTQSYAAFVAFGVGLAFYALTHPTIPRRMKWRASLAALMVSFLFFVSQLNTPKFQQFLDFGGRTSSSIRVEVYTIAGNLIQSHSFLGIGLGQFGTQYRLNAHSILGHVPYEWVMIHPHNLFLALWLNTGFLGVLAMVWVLILLFWKPVTNDPSFWQLFRQGLKPFLVQVKTYFDQKIGSSETFSRIARAMLVMTLVHGLFDTPFFKNDLAYLWWLMVAMGI